MQLGFPAGCRTVAEIALPHAGCAGCESGLGAIGTHMPITALETVIDMELPTASRMQPVFGSFLRWTGSKVISVTIT